MDETLIFELADRVVFILVEPSHPGNIGSAARALKTMGWKHLRQNFGGSRNDFTTVEVTRFTLPVTDQSAGFRD